MLGSLAKVIGLSVASLGSFNMPTRTAEEPTTSSVAQIENGSNGFTVQTYTTANPPYTWIYKQSGTDTQVYANANYKSICLKQQVQNDQTDTWQFDYNNNKIMRTYILIKMETIQNQAQYCYLYDLRPELTGSLPASTLAYVNVNTDVYWSYESSWETYFNYNVGRYSVDSINTEIENMTSSNVVNTYKCDTIQYTYNNLGPQLPPDLEDRTLDFYKNPTIPMYILIVLTAERDNSSITYNDTRNMDLQLDFVTVGYTTYNTAQQITQEVIDLPGLCFSILTMPFSFISQAFNLTLFPGTAYQLNISTLFLSIIGILIFVFIVKKLIARS